jgi:hypothetical protein
MGGAIFDKYFVTTLELSFLGLELLEQVPGLDIILVPISG